MTSRGIPLVLSARTRKGFTLFWAALFVLSLLLQYASITAPRNVLAATGLKAGTYGGFEIDGDLAANNAASNPGGLSAANIDGGLAGLVNGEDWLSPTPTGATIINDLANSSSDVWFDKGKDLDTRDWTLKTSEVSPDKSDMKHVMAYAKFVGSDAYLFAGVQRIVNKGDTTLVLEVNRKPWKIFGAGQMAKPDRSVGDLFLNLEFATGGNNPEVTVFKVLTVTDYPGQGQTVTIGPDIATTAAVRSAVYSKDSDLSATFPDGTDTIHKNEFAEFGVNLSALNISTACPNGFAVANIRTRSGGEALGSSDMKDFSAPFPIDLNDCGTLKIVKKNFDASANLAGATFVITPNPTTGTGSLTVTDNQPPDTNLADTGVIEIPGAIPGTYSVQETGAPTGYLLPTPATQSVNVPQNSTGTVTFRDPQASLSLVKSVDKPVVYSGTTVTYSYLVTNTGQVPLSHISISDDQPVADLSCPADALDPGQSTTCTATMVITGDTINTATASGTAQSQTFTSDPSSATVQVINPSLSIVKTGDQSAVETGATVNYSYLVTNTGNDPIIDIAVSDSPVPTGLSCPETELAPGENMTCTSSVVLDSGDFTAGEYKNTATVSGTDSLDGEVNGGPSSWTVKLLVPGLNIQKDASAPVILSGDSVTYTYTVTNSGEVGLTNVVITDDRLGPVCTIPSLPVGASDSCQMTTTLNATTTNTGYASGDTPEGNPVGPVSDEETVTVIHPALSIDKSASDSTVYVGDPVTYSYTVTNTGDVAITDIAVVDAPSPGTITCVSTTLAPLESTECTATTNLFEDTTNSAYATGTETTLDTPVQSDPDSARVTVINPELTLTKVVNPKTVNISGLVTYTYVVTNTGNVAITDIGLVDNPLGAITCPQTSLAPTESMTCEVADVLIDHTTTNLAQASGLDSLEHGVFSNIATATVTVTNPNLTALKSVDKPTANPGEVLNYTITITNSGDGAAIGQTASDYIGDLLVYGGSYNDDASNGGLYDASTKTISWTGLDIAADGGTIVLTFSVTVGDSFPAGVTLLPNTIVAASNCPVESDEPDPACSTDTTVTVEELPGTITIEKQTIPNGSNQAFTFDPSWEQGTFPLTDGATHVSSEVPPGQYMIEEINIPEGWTLTGVTGSGCAWNEDGSVSITLEENGRVHCVFTNTLRETPPPPPPAPSMTIAKTNGTTGAVTPGTAVSFTLTIGVQNATSIANTTIVDQLPAGIGSATAISNGGVYDPTTNKITWSSLTVTNGTQLTYTATVSGTASPGTYVNTATITQGPCALTCSASSTVSVEAGQPPAGGVAGATATPRVTPPNTSTTNDGTTSTPGLNLGLILLVLAGVMAGLGVLAPLPARTRRRDRRE